MGGISYEQESTGEAVKRLKSEVNISTRLISNSQPHRSAEMLVMAIMVCNELHIP